MSRSHNALPQTMPRTEERATTDDGARLWVASGGIGGQLSLAHGGPGLWDYLEPLASLLEQFATIHRWDQRGAGRSDLIGPYTVDRFVAEMDAVREHLGVESWVAGGHSWGAVMALLFALRYPKRTLAVLYVAGNGLEWHKWREFYQREFERRLGPERLQKFMETTDPSESNRLRWSADYASFDVARPHVDRMLAQGFSVNLECNRAIGTEMDANSDIYFANLEALRVPVLIIQGRDDPRPLAACDSLEMRLSSCSRVVLDGAGLDGAGHFPWVERPYQFVSAVTEWLSQFKGFLN
jgi:proline iminopeptidase